MAANFELFRKKGLRGVGAPVSACPECPVRSACKNPQAVPAKRPEALRYEDEVSSTGNSIYKVYHLISRCVFKGDAFESVVANVVNCLVIPRHFCMIL